MKKIYFITSNKGKVLEAKTKFIKFGIELNQNNLGYPEIQADTLEEVAIFGVHDIKKRFNESFFLEDSGLFIDSLNGFPGVYSAYVFYKIGCEGILKLMKDTEITKRKATFKSVIAYYEPDKKPKLFIGEAKGTISEKAFGSHGFGYDPIFIPDGDKKTFAQMETDEKNSLSHRGKSLEKLVDFFKNQ